MIDMERTVCLAVWNQLGWDCYPDLETVFPGKGTYLERCLWGAIFSTNSMLGTPDLIPETLRLIGNRENRGCTHDYAE